jgi:hypothetical protein
MLSPVFIHLDEPQAHRHSLWSRLCNAVDAVPRRSKLKLAPPSLFITMNELRYTFACRP